MEKRRAARFKRIAVVIVVAISVSGVGVAAFWRWFEPMHVRVRLLCDTDHQTLLEACQELAGQVREGNLKPDEYRFGPWRSGAAGEFPQPIQALRPTYVLVDGDGRVTIEMFGGLTHFGIHAYPEDYEVRFPGFKYGDRELIPNLWYYDDEYLRDPQFDRAVSELLERGRAS